MLQAEVSAHHPDIDKRTQLHYKPEGLDHPYLHDTHDKGTCMKLSVLTNLFNINYQFSNI